MAHFDLPLEDLRAYQAPAAEPADFDEFWQRTLAAHADTLRKPTFERCQESVYALVDAYDVTFAGFGGQPIRGWFIEPAGNTDPLACIVSFIGYGGGRGFPLDHLAPVAAGFAHFVMDTRGQGGATADDHPAGPQCPGFMTRGIESPETYYYRRLFVDAVHAVEGAAAHPHVDASRIALRGGSQGGGIALAAGALAPEAVKLVLADVPFLCHFRRATTLVDAYPYREIVDYLKSHTDRVEQVFSTLAYFDGINFAPRIRARCLFSAALMDEVCPPSTIFAAYNRLTAAKDMVIYEFNQHEGGQTRQVLAQLEFARRHL